MDKSIEEKRCIAKEILLSSPPGQFQESLSNIHTIFYHDDNNSNTILSRDFIQEIESFYNSQCGRDVLLKKGDINHCIGDEDEFGKSLDLSFQKYIKENYSDGNGIESHFTIQKVSGPLLNNMQYEIKLYGQRIKIPQYNTGSWYAKYIINQRNDQTITINGSVDIFCHAFENGNVQLKSKVDVSPQTFKQPSSSLADEIIKFIHQFEEERLLPLLKCAYNNMSNDILKKMRRVMPVTRTKFDWNVDGNKFMNTMGMNVHRKR
jgi:hypothetical protein